MSDATQLPANPMLLNPSSPSGQRVEPLQRKTGDLAPQPFDSDTPTAYYACTVLNHHMHRTDGKRLGFVFGIFETRDWQDVKYLNEEIDLHQNPFIRRASDEEIKTYKMKRDPRGTIVEEIAPEIAEQTKQQLQDVLAARMNSMGLSDEQKQMLLASLGATQPSDAQKIAAIDSPIKPEAIEMQGAKAFQVGVVGSNRIVNTATSNQAGEKK